MLQSMGAFHAKLAIIPTMTSIETLADDLGVDPADVMLILMQHDTPPYNGQVSGEAARDVRAALDLYGERTTA